MSEETLQNQVVKLVAETIEESTGQVLDLTPDTPLIDEGYLDSLTIIQLFSRLQDAFGIELEMDDITEETFGTPSAIAALIEAQN